MPDGQWPGQGLHQGLRGEVVAHIAEAPRRLESLIKIVGHDPAGFLPAMLQRMQSEGHKICRILDADDAENTAFLMKFVIPDLVAHGVKIERMGGGHLLSGHEGLRIPLAFSPLS